MLFSWDPSVLSQLDMNILPRDCKRRIPPNQYVLLSAIYANLRKAEGHFDINSLSLRILSPNQSLQSGSGNRSSRLSLADTCHMENIV
jgi:hypothetical protein